MTEHQPVIYTIICMVEGENSLFLVKIKSDAMVGELKDAIKSKKQPKFDNFAADKLRLFKVELDGYGDLKKETRQLQLNQQTTLHPLDTLAKIFNNIPKKDKVHILVQLPRLAFLNLVPSAGQKHSRSSSSDIDDLRPRKKYLTSKGQMAPSLRGDPRVFAKEQKDPATRILCGRPLETHPPIPLALLYEVFGEFLDNIESHRPTADDNNFAFDLADAMSGFFSTENSRARKFRDILKEYGIELTRDVISDDYITDGSAEEDGFFYIISEFGRGGADPLLQAVSSYLESVRDHEDRHSILPCILIYYYGAAIGFAGVVITDKVSCQVLTPIIPLNFHPTDVEMHNHLARILGALKAAYEKLKGYYKLGDFNREQNVFPYPRRYKSLNEDNAIHTFRYIERYPDKLIFFANDEGGRSICVKFSRRYSLDAHIFAAKIDLAPQLLGFETLQGGWFMSIMEDLTSDWKLYEKGTRISKEQAKDFLGKIANFHREGFVHGDIRDSNLLFCRKDEENHCGIKLVDFEWSGKQEEVYYPAGLTREGRPDSAVDGVLIEKEHDEEVVVGLIEELTQ